VKFPFDAPDGSPMQEAILPNRPKPKLVVVLVWDAGGRYVLSLFPRATPHLQELVRKGVWYENASVGSNPRPSAPERFPGRTVWWTTRSDFPTVRSQSRGPVVPGS
jgi:hypothetical protein